MPGFTTPLTPPPIAVVNESVEDVPRVMDSVVAAGVTTIPCTCTTTLCVTVSPSPVAVTVTVHVPGATVLIAAPLTLSLVVSVSTDVPSNEEFNVTLLLLNVPVT